MGHDAKERYNGSAEDRVVIQGEDDAQVAANLQDVKRRVEAVRQFPDAWLHQPFREGTPVGDSELSPAVDAPLDAVTPGLIQPFQVVVEGLRRPELQFHDPSPTCRR